MKRREFLVGCLAGAASWKALLATAAGSKLNVIDCTNLIANGYFLHGMSGWGAAYGLQATVQVRHEGGYFLQQVSNGNVCEIAVGLAGHGARLDHMQNVPIDPEQRYRYSVYAKGSTPLTVSMGGRVYTSIPSEESLGVNLAIGTEWSEASGVLDGWKNAYVFKPAIKPVGNTPCRLLLTGISFIPENRLPMTKQVHTEVSAGTHEAAVLGDHFYTISHSYNEVAKFDFSLRRQGAVAVSDYPHDIVAFRGHLWVVTWNGKRVHRIDPRTMTEVATYALIGSRSGHGIAHDGTYLYIGGGYTGAGEPTGIIKLDPQTGRQSELTKDVDGFAANTPIVCLQGSVWSLRSPDLQTGDVKRIDARRGLTLATIDAHLGKVYGLGTDGRSVYANGWRGVARIDPRTNTLAEVYRFRRGVNGATNLKFDGRRMWGATQDAATFFHLDIASNRLTEEVVTAGAPKWALPLPTGDVVFGLYYTPELVKVRAA